MLDFITFYISVILQSQIKGDIYESILFYKWVFKILGVSAQTLRNWDNSGKLHPHHTSSNGYRYYSHEQLNQVMNIKLNLDRKVIGYCRVSSNKQRVDLERQIQNMKTYLTAQGRPFEIISDIGSGINYKRKD